MIEALRQILPAQAVLTDPADCAPFERDWRHLYANKALAVVLPQTTEQVAAVVRLCAARGVALVPQGGNTGLVGGGVPGPGAPQLVLSLARMTQILDLDPVGETLTVQAGATLHAVQEAAAAQDKLFPVSFAAEGTAQIGGVISTNAGGVQVLAYGSMRAQVLGLEVVLPDGRVWNGLRALRKDNTGFDLKQLFIGAEGTLGIITAACLRLSPSVNASAMALVGVSGPQAALGLFQRLRARAGAALTLCEYLARPAMELGLAHAQGGKLPFAAPAYVLAELSAHDPAAEINALLETILAEALEAEAATDALIAQSGRERAALLALREAVPEGELAEGGAIKHDIAVPLAAIPATVAAIEALLAAEYPAARLNIFGHIGDGNLHVNIRPPEGQPLTVLNPVKTALTARIEALAVAQGGSFSAEHGIGQSRLPGMRAHKSAVELDLMRALKHALDPQNLLNPGKTIPEPEPSP
jgi:FAD/FMN-containing dehydrogenase